MLSYIFSSLRENSSFSIRTKPDGPLISRRRAVVESSIASFMDFTAKIGGFFRSIINPESDSLNTDKPTEENR